MSAIHPGARIGVISEITRYPVKSMAGVGTETAELGFHGLAGDRRFAFHRVGYESDFPWLSASSFPDLIRYQPLCDDAHSREVTTRCVRTPSGTELDIRSDELRRELEEASGMTLQLMQLKHGFFDEAPLSIMTTTTIAAIGEAAGMNLDRRRFRMNVVIDAPGLEPFGEDAWVGCALQFGDGEQSARVNVTLRDVRCMMINLDPDTAEQDGRALRKVVELNGNNAGVYGGVLRPGRICVGQEVRFGQEVPGNGKRILHGA